MNAHNPIRPSWGCAACDEPWPCRLARKQLGEGYPSGPDALAVHMLRLMGTAEGDLRRPGAALYERFVAWTLRPGRVCRVCGKPNHDVLPGVPPRLFPCYRINELMRDDRP